MSQTKVPIQNQNSKNFRSKCTRDQQPSMLRTATLGSKQDWGVDLPLKRRLAKRERTGTQGYFSPHLWRENKTTNQTEEGASTHRDDWYGSADLPNRIESIKRKNSPSPTTCKSSTMATKSPSFAFLLYHAHERVCIRFRWRPLRKSHHCTGETWKAKILLRLRWRANDLRHSSDASPPCPKFSPHPAHPLLFPPSSHPCFYPSYSANNFKIDK